MIEVLLFAVSSTIPHLMLNRHHNPLSYHRVREALAVGVLNLQHIDGTLNPSDRLTIFRGWAKFWPLVQCLLFWKGETNIPTTMPIDHILAVMKDGKA
jgi:hypothetical protein